MLCTIYLFLGPVREGADIISAAFAYGLLSVSAATLAYVALVGMGIRRSLQVAFIPPNETLLSGIASDIVIKCSSIWIPPLTQLTVTPRFLKGSLEPSGVRFHGKGRGERRALLQVTFPHRGRWQVEELVCEYSDVLGLVHIRWQLPHDATITVHPHNQYQTHIPVLSSSQRPGDLAVDTLNRQGDPYDIKRYHPTDGIKKIIWKALAKRGELLSRHPEASMTPEGYVVIMVLAQPGDDALVAHAIAYTKMLHELQLDLVVGCQGISSRHPARSPEAALDLLVDSVWDAAVPDTLFTDTSALISHCISTTTSLRLDRLVIFCARERFTGSDSIKELSELSSWLLEKGISPVFCFAAGDALAPNQVTRYGRLVRWLALPQASSSDKFSSEAYSSFLAGCAQQNWEVYV